MQAGAGEAEDHVAGPNAPAVDDVLALDDADAEAGHVEIARLIEIRQDRRLAADQGTVGLHAAVADALDQGMDQGRIVLGHRQIIEEQQRFAAGAEAVIDRHGDEVDADGIVLAGQGGDLELAADAVGAGDQDRMAVVPGEQAAVVIEAEEAGEEAALFPGGRCRGRVQHPRRVCSTKQRTDGAHALAVDAQVQPCILVGEVLRRWVRGRRHGVRLSGGERSGDSEGYMKEGDGRDGSVSWAASPFAGWL